ncbi:MAG: hypothetical protein AVDCRST_MAG18-2934 [uncultured Thermomicrobiales bacterium]|jgi:hypothetical protein|uniref:Uncharacterized protein n=1 Tax=uncultured Thermomicrobiales bacterium TaxID=1645740 RepID=A0A6J4VHZ3_9BACT|nr:MAG: hypothetical protein AVDCRST_MAG18-2934 [uncultured Thermomicrobiales bacterium]
MEAPLTTLIFLYLAMGGLAAGLLEFGVGAMLWAEEKFLIAFGFVAAMCGLYVGLRLLSMILDGIPA